MEGEIPSRKPGVLPFVRHGEYLIRIEMLPIMVATVLALLRRRRLRRITLEPAPDVIAVELLGPDHSSACLALDSAEVFVCHIALQICIKRVGLYTPGRSDFFKVGKPDVKCLSREP